MATENRKRNRRSFGTLRKLPSGRYQAFYVGPDGVTHKAASTFITKALADVWLAEQQTRISKGDWDQRETRAQTAAKIGKGITLGEMAKEWREQRINKYGEALSPTTLVEYERMMVSVMPELARLPIRAIGTDEVKAWFFPLRAKSPNMAAKTYSHLSTLMKYALRNKWIDENPCDIEFGSTTQDREPEVPTVAQVETMISNAKPQWKALVALAAWSGLRKGELLALTREDLVIHKFEDKTAISVDVTKSVVVVAGEALVKAPKTKSSIRSVYLDPRGNDAVLAHLNQIDSAPSTLLFPSHGTADGHVTNGGFNRIWYPIRKTADYGGRFHSLRAFALTQFGLSGATQVEIMKRGGHSDIRVAARYQRDTGREWELLNRS